MALINLDGRVIADEWQLASQPEDLLTLQPVIVPWKLWRGEGDDAGLERGFKAPLGLHLGSEVRAEDIADDLSKLSLIALEFPKFTDGRPYSTARQLRQRYGFAGEIRAVGQILLDQVAFMARCGFDMFEVIDGHDLGLWRQALAGMATQYQPAHDQTSSKLSASGSDPESALGSTQSSTAAHWAY